MSIASGLLAVFLTAGNSPVAIQECIDGEAGGYDCSRVDLAAFMSSAEIGGGPLNDIWGWTDPDSGREFALVGRYAGTSFVEITDPSNPIYLGELPTRNLTAAHHVPLSWSSLCHDDCDAASSWRDIKVHDNHALIVSEEGGHGLQVFDLTRLLNVASPPATFDEDAHFGGFGNAHNIAVNNDSDRAYVIGAGSNGGGPILLDVSDPQAPSEIGNYTDDGYTHDIQCVIYQGPDADHQGSEICLASNEDTLTIIDFSDPANGQILSRESYDRVGYTHQGWLSEDQGWFYLNDELAGSNHNTRTRTLVFDVSDLEAPVVDSEYYGSDLAIHHNNYVLGDYLYQSNYTSGLRILDISTPDAPVEYAYFDSQPDQEQHVFEGTWSNYPWFESGTVVFSDINDGLFVVQPQLPDPGDAEADLTLNAVIESAAHGGDNNLDRAANVRLTVENTGPADAPGVEWVASLPISGELEIVGDSPGECDSNGRVLRCRHGDLASGNAFVVDLVARSDEETDAGLLIWATATRPDPATPDNRAHLILPEAVAPPNPPQADFDHDCNGLSCSLDASATTLGDAEITDWEWDLGDGNTASGEQISHDFGDAGSYTVVLTVTDENELSDQQSRTFSVSPPGAPSANFSVECDGLSCAFDASESAAGSAALASLEWDFGDGGSANLSASETTVSHDYAEAGDYTVSLSVVDEDGLSSETSQSVTVSEAASGGGGSDSGCSLGRGNGVDPLLWCLALLAGLGLFRRRVV